MSGTKISVGVFIRKFKDFFLIYLPNLIYSQGEKIEVNASKQGTWKLSVSDNDF